MMMSSRHAYTVTQILEAMSPYVSALFMGYMQTDGKEASDVRALSELELFFKRRGIWLGSSPGLDDRLRALIDAQNPQTPSPPATPT
jgi:hypothetical protein